MQSCWHNKYPDDVRLPFLIWDTVGPTSFNVNPERSWILQTFVQNIVHSPRWNLYLTDWGTNWYRRTQPEGLSDEIHTFYRCLWISSRFSRDNLHVVFSLLFQNRMLLHDGASRPHWSMNRLRTTVKVCLPTIHTTHLLLQLDLCYWACPKLCKDISWSMRAGGEWLKTLRAFFVTV